MLALVPGTLVRDRYRLGELLGEGGMGVVYVATDELLDRPVALKFPRVAGTDDKARARLAREARLVARLESAHAARLLDASLDGDAPFLVFERLRGCDLAHHFEGGPLDAPEAVDLMMDACEAIAEAHTRGLIHRDIKPANLFLTDRIAGPPIVKVLDFGVARDIAGDTASLTGSGDVVGSIAYMAPEQLSSARAATGRADIWALGVVLFEAIEGEHPFQADDLEATIERINNLAPELTAKAVPSGLARVIEKCLAKDPADRFADAAELRVALAPFATSATRPKGDAPVRAAVDVDVTQEPIESTAREPRPAREGWLPVAVVAVVLSGSGYLAYRAGDDAPVAVPAASATPTQTTAATAPSSAARALSPPPASATEPSIAEAPRAVAARPATAKPSSNVAQRSTNKLETPNNSAPPSDCPDPMCSRK